jgi:hypothetical protein
MPDLEQQLRDYGTFLDGLDSDPVVSAEPDRHRSRLVAAAAVVALLVVSSIAIAARRDASDHVTIRGSGSNGSTATQPTATQPSAAPTTVFDSSAIASAHPTFQQQVEQLDAWAKTRMADDVDGRPILVSEYELCDYRGAFPSVGKAPQLGFASYFPLGEPLTEARLADGCMHRDDIPRGTPPPAHRFCAARRRGPVYDPDAVVANPSTKPVVVFGNRDCATAGYEPFPSGLLAQLNEWRRVEIEIMAVPRSCPTQNEAAFWVGKITDQELGEHWSIIEPPAPESQTSGTLPPLPPVATNCVRPYRVDWDLHRVDLERF